MPRGSQGIVHARRIPLTGDTTGIKDTAAIQKALDLAGANGGLIELGIGTYYVGDEIVIPAGISIRGAHKYNTIVKLADGVTVNAVMHSQEWTAGNDTSDAPLYLGDFCIDANRDNAVSGHAFVSQNYWSTFERMQFKNVDGDGLRIPQSEQDASELTNTLVETRVLHCDFRSITGKGIYGEDASNSVATVTDGYIDGCTFQLIDDNAVQLDSAAGWNVTKNHFYGCKKSLIRVSRAFETLIAMNYGETWGTSATAGTYCMVDASTGFTTGTLIVMGNRCFHAGGVNAAVSMRGILITGGSAVTVNVVVQGNVLRGATATLETHGIRVTCNAASTVVNLAQSGNLVSGFATQTSLNVNGGTINTAVAV